MPIIPVSSTHLPPPPLRQYRHNNIRLSDMSTIKIHQNEPAHEGVTCLPERIEKWERRNKSFLI